MDPIASLRFVIQLGNDLLLQVTDDLTPEQVNWMPPGTVNPIGQTFAHIIGIQDRCLNSFIKGQPTIWESENWSETLGLPDANRMSRENAAQYPIDLATYRAYAVRVMADVKAYLETADEAEFNRTVEGFRGPAPVGQLIARMFSFHTASHLGEICAVKGMQGLKGLPF